MFLLVVFVIGLAWRMSMWLVVLSVLPLFLGLAIYPIFRKMDNFHALLDGFVLCSVGGLLILHILPHCLHESGFWGFLALCVGLALPFVLDRFLSGKHEKPRTSATVGLVVFIGVAIHAFLDGMGLSTTNKAQHHSEMLAMAIVLHRLPIGVALAWLLLPQKKWGQALLVAFGIGIFTLFGFFLGKGALSPSQELWLLLFQAMMVGVLAHVLINKPSFLKDRSGPSLRHWGAIGGAIGFALLYLLQQGEHSHQHDHNTVEHAFTMLFSESAPALLLAFLAAGLVHVFLKTASIRWLQRGNHLTQSAKGVAFGLPLPICSCGVLPLYQSLTRAGAPGAAAIAFLVATPELGLDAVLLSLPLLGTELTLARVGAAILAAFSVALFVGPMCASPTAASTTSSAQDKTPLLQRLWSGVRYGYVEMFDKLLPWILFGLLIAAILSPLLPLKTFSTLPAIWQVPLFALLGMPAYVCASGTTPLVAILLVKGLSPGAAIAFLLTGPATNATTFGVLQELHNKRIAMMFAASMFVVSCLLGWGTNALLYTTTFVPKLQHGHEHHHHMSTLQYLSTLGFGALVLASFWRMGPREMLQRLFSSVGHTHGENESDCCGTDDTTSSCCGTETAPKEPSCCGTETAPKESSCCGTETPETAPKESSCCGSKKD